MRKQLTPRWLTKLATAVLAGSLFVGFAAVAQASTPYSSAAPAAVRTFDSGLVDLGANHFMRTSGSLDPATGNIAAQTRTLTCTLFGGFHGATHIIFGDANDAPVYSTGVHRYGVDGRLIGTSDRTDAWWESMPVEDVSRVTAQTIFLVWAPDGFQHILDRWVQAGKSIAELVAIVGGVAQVIRV